MLMEYGLHDVATAGSNLSEGVLADGLEPRPMVKCTVLFSSDCGSIEIRVVDTVLPTLASAVGRGPLVDHDSDSHVGP